MSDVGRFVSFIVGVGFILATLGTLGEITDALRAEATKTTRRGIFSLGAFNRSLMSGGKYSLHHRGK
jgi:hypothetical protein